MKPLIEKDNKHLSISCQCNLLGLPKSTFYYEPVEPKSQQLKIMEEMELIYLDFPYYGSRKMAKALQKKGFSASRGKARRPGSFNSLLEN